MAEYIVDKFSYGGNTYKLQDNESGYVTAAGAASAAPVQSVNGQTGVVSLTIPVASDTYSSTSSNVMTGKGVNAALQTLDSSISATTGQAISAITITDGKISASSKIAVGDANQNAFSNVKVGSTTIAADTTTDTLELVAGTDITLTPDSTNDKVTIAFSNASGYTKNTGTVTSVGISNATNGGLSVSGSPVTGSGSITVGHSNVLTSAQTTQAVYPIAIDKNGHISSYGTAVTIPNNSNWVNGSATGSVRTVGSATEDANYTMGLRAVAVGYLTKASGTDAYAEGENSVASATAAHAEGGTTVASGSGSHAEGSETTASGNYGSHAEGYKTTASGQMSHAEGRETTASGSVSHVSGRGTIANHLCQTAFGRYNIADPSTEASNSIGNYIEIVGNGTTDNARSNARTLDWDGNETLAGKLTLGASPTANMDAATKQYVDTNMTVVTFTPDAANNNLIISVQQASSILNGNEVNY